MPRRRAFPSVPAAALAAAALLLAPAAPSGAQSGAQSGARSGTATPEATRAAAGETPPESAADVLAERRAEAVAGIETLSRSISLSQERRRALETEIAAIARDEAAIAAALIQSAKTERKLADDIAGVTADILRLEGESAELRASLSARSAVLAEVLAGLQRLGRNPPPAILVTPQDALSSVRSAVLLGAVVPPMRDETLALRADLDRLAALARRSTEARAALESGLRAQVDERGRLDLLLEEKKRLTRQSEEALDAEARRLEEMAANVKSLQALLGTIDRSIADVQALADKRRAAIEKARRPDAAAPALSPSAPFATLKGLLPVPVSGTRIVGFGERNAAGVETAGDTFRTRSGAIVTAPVDGIVAFAAPFRSYGHIVILDAGGGYRMVMAGLAKLGVRPGQTVLAGEPLGGMDDSGGGEAGAPELYVELRKDGQAVDPAAWWQATISGTLSGLQGDDT